MSLHLELGAPSGKKQGVVTTSLSEGAVRVTMIPPTVGVSNLLNRDSHSLRQHMPTYLGGELQCDRSSFVISGNGKLSVRTHGNGTVTIRIKEERQRRSTPSRSNAPDLCYSSLSEVESNASSRMGKSSASGTSWKQLCVERGSQQAAETIRSVSSQSIPETPSMEFPEIRQRNIQRVSEAPSIEFPEIRHGNSDRTLVSLDPQAIEDIYPRPLYSVCDFCAERCLDPFDKDQRKEHMERCILELQNDVQLSEGAPRSLDKVCGICWEVVVNKEPDERWFGILQNCNHSFCYSCLDRWRNHHGDSGQVAKDCPHCRVDSDYVFKVIFWVETPEEKELLFSIQEKEPNDSSCEL